MRQLLKVKNKIKSNVFHEIILVVLSMMTYSTRRSQLRVAMPDKPQFLPITSCSYFSLQHSLPCVTISDLTLHKIYLICTTHCQHTVRYLNSLSSSGSASLFLHYHKSAILPQQNPYTYHESILALTAGSEDNNISLHSAIHC